MTFLDWFAQNPFLGIVLLLFMLEAVSVIASIFRRAKSSGGEKPD